MKIEDHKFSDSDVLGVNGGRKSYLWLDMYKSKGLALNKSDAIAIADHFGVLKEFDITDYKFKHDYILGAEIGGVDSDELYINMQILPGVCFSKEDIKAMAKHFGIIESVSNE